MIMLHYETIRTSTNYEVREIYEKKILVLPKKINTSIIFLYYYYFKKFSSTTEKNGSD